MQTCPSVRSWRSRDLTRSRVLVASEENVFVYTRFLCMRFSNNFAKTVSLTTWILPSKEFFGTNWKSNLQFFCEEDLPPVPLVSALESIFDCRVLLRSYYFDLPYQNGWFKFFLKTAVLKIYSPRAPDYNNVSVAFLFSIFPRLTWHVIPWCSGANEISQYTWEPMKLHNSLGTSICDYDEKTEFDRIFNTVSLRVSCVIKPIVLWRPRKAP